jgi:hypothetical protein
LASPEYIFSTSHATPKWGRIVACESTSRATAVVFAVMYDLELGLGQLCVPAVRMKWWFEWRWEHESFETNRKPGTAVDRFQEVVWIEGPILLMENFGQPG